MILKQFENT